MREGSLRHINQFRGFNEFSFEGDINFPSTLSISFAFDQISFASFDFLVSIKVAERSLIPVFQSPFSQKPRVLLICSLKNTQVDDTDTNFGFLIATLTYVPLPWQHE